MLSTHPELMCYPALFVKEGWIRGRELPEADHDLEIFQRLLPLDEKWHDPDQRSARMDEFLADMDAINPEPCWGLKHHLGPRGNPLTAAIIDRKLPVILLRRDNILACYSSNKIVSVTGQGALRAGATAIEAQVPFDPEEFHVYRERRKAIYAYWEPIIAATGVPILDMQYGEARTRTGINRIVSFVGVPTQTLGRWPTAKRNPNNIVKRFSNRAEVRRYLIDNGLEAWEREA